MKIDLEGVEHQLLFNMGFVRMLKKEYEIDLVMGYETDSDKFYQLGCGVIYCSTAKEAERAGIKPPYTFQKDGSNCPLCVEAFSLRN